MNRWSKPIHVPRALGKSLATRGLLVVTAAAAMAVLVIAVAVVVPVADVRSVSGAGGAALEPTAVAEAASQPEVPMLEVQETKTLFAIADVQIGPHVWSPDSNSFLYYRLTGRGTDWVITDPNTNARHSIGIVELWRYDLDTGTHTKLSDNGANASWSSDGRQIRYQAYRADGKSIDDFALDSMSLQATILARSDSLRLQHLPNGATVLVQDGKLVTRYPDGQAQAWTDTVIDNSLDRTFWVSPEGSRVALAQRNRLVVETITGERVQIAEDFYSYPGLAWSNDSKRLVYSTAGNPRELRICEVATAKTTTLFTAKLWNEEFLSPEWAPDGRAVTFGLQAKRSGVPGSLLAVRPDGGSVQKLADDAITAVWAPDGKHLAYERATGKAAIGLITLR